MLLGIAYTMITEQEICDKLSDGDYIEFTNTGMKLSNEPAMKATMDEHIPDWPTNAIKSRKHSKGYKVSFTKTTAGVFYVKGEWVT